MIELDNKCTIDIWETEKAEPKLGDVIKVTGKGSGASFNAIFYHDDKISNRIWALVPGDSAPQVLTKNSFTFEKTGKHIDIQGMLDSITED